MEVAMKHVLCFAFVLLLVLGCAQATDTAIIVNNEVKAEKPEGLTFRILASRAYPQDEDIIQKGVAEPGRDIRDQNGRIIARWVPIVDSQKSSFENPNMVIREREKTLEALVKYDDSVDITGEYLTHVGRGVGRAGIPGVSFELNAIGANKFARLTSANLPDPAQDRFRRHLGVVINDQLYAAPTIMARIQGSGILEFNAGHTEAERQKMNQEVDDLIEVLQTRYPQTKPSIRTWLFPR